MLIRLKGRDFRMPLAARLAIACTAAAAALPFAAQPASAYVPCPTQDIEAGEIVNWDTLWPTGGADAKGVTLCHATGSVFSKGYLQIADLADGAKVRLISKRDASSPPPGRLEAYVTYEKRTVDEWYSFIRGGNSVISPAYSRLFSTTNASFFKNSDNGSPTTLPFPHRADYLHETWGTTVWDQWRTSRPGCPNGDAPNPDYCAPKRALRIGNPNSSTIQRVNIVQGSAPFYNPIWQYDADQAYYYLADVDSGYTPQAWDGTMGFFPDYQIGEESRRNYIGAYANKVYIFTSDTEYTNAEATAIMEAIQPGMTVMQLDGGGSAQFHSAYGHMDSNIPILDREVPDVLAIYRAP